MSNSYRFFNNRECKFFPCHKGVDPAQFNCLFCFCPLYFLERCGGNAQMTNEGVKDCTPCTIPHSPGGYEFIMKRLGFEFKAIRESGKKSAKG